MGIFIHIDFFFFFLRIHFLPLESLLELKSSSEKQSESLLVHLLMEQTIFQ